LGCVLAIADKTAQRGDHESKRSRKHERRKKGREGGRKATARPPAETIFFFGFVLSLFRVFAISFGIVVVLCLRIARREPSIEEAAEFQDRTRSHPAEQ
jgi:hypothetical protein